MLRARLLLPALVLAFVAALGGGLYWWWHPAPPPAPPPQTSGTRLAELLDSRRLSDDQRDALASVLPTILRENIRIAADRQRVQEISLRYARDPDIGEDDFNWLKDMAMEYRLAPQSRSDSHFFGELMARVDVVPPSLVLAHLIQQGMILSRNDTVDALTFRRETCHRELCIGLGLHPARFGSRKSANAFEVSDDVIHRYILSLNTDEAYEEFRLQRLGQRNRGEDVRGLPLVSSLEGPLAGGEGYVSGLRSLIVLNNLQDMD